MKRKGLEGKNLLHAKAIRVKRNVSSFQYLKLTNSESFFQKPEQRTLKQNLGAAINTFVGSFGCWKLARRDDKEMY